jgi:hypothetical protein
VAGLVGDLRAEEDPLVLGRELGPITRAPSRAGPAVHRPHTAKVSPGFNKTTREEVCDSTSDLKAPLSVSIGVKVS